MTWLHEALIVRRWYVILSALVIGLTLAGVVYVRQIGSDTAARQRTQLFQNDVRQRAANARLADAVRRLSKLEHPTKAEVRAEIGRLLRQITPAQARRLARAIHNSPTASPVGGAAHRGTRPSPRPPASSPHTNHGRAPVPAPAPRPPSTPPTRPPVPAPGRPLLPPVHVPSICLPGPLHLPTCLAYIW